MNAKSYKDIQWLRYQYTSYMPFNGKITSDELLALYNAESMEEVNKLISAEDIAFVEEWLKSGNSNVFLTDKIREDYSKMTPEEILQNLEDFFNYGIYDFNLLLTIPNKFYIIENCNNDKGINYLLDLIPEEDLYKYINENGIASEKVIDYISESQNILELINTMKAIDSDFNRAKIILKSGNDEWLPYIEDQFYRTQIVKATLDNDFDKTELLDEMKEYNVHLDKINQFTDEKSKAEYISKIDDKDMKMSFLSQIHERENRDIIVKSFSRQVDPNIESLDKLSQTMIREFFEDVLGDKFTDDKKEKLEIIFNMINVSFGKLATNTNGQANHTLRNIIISDRHQDNLNRNLGFLVHEYEHMLSIFDFSYTRNKPNDTIEEGMADLFGDLVINHYLDKHKNVKLDGKIVRIDKPYTTYSGYDFENGWIRTMIAGLESSGKDLEAVGEYILGDKLKFTEMVFGKDIAETKETTDFGMPVIITGRSEIYHSPELDFSNIDKGSIYYKRNYILPLFELQNRLENKIDVVGVLSKEEVFFANDVANKYFDDKKFYEVPTDELREFVSLLHAQVTPNQEPSAIIDILDYKNKVIDQLTEGEIKDNSFEILDSIAILFENETVKAGSNLEKVIYLAFKEEIRKIEEGQSIEITQYKKDKIIDRYRNMFSSKTENNMYINDYINDFCFKSEQMGLQPKDGKQILITSDGIRKFAQQEDVLMEKEHANDATKSLQTKNNDNREIFEQDTKE